MIPSKEINPEGLHLRYNVIKTDGTAVDPGAEYFVLRLDEGGSDKKHIEACRKAIVKYAHEIKNHLPKLADDILKRYGNLINIEVTLKDEGQDMLCIGVDPKTSKIIYSDFHSTIYVGSYTDLNQLEIGKLFPIHNDVIKFGYLRFEIENIRHIYEQ